MDSQERHELRENDLAEFFKNFGEWWSNYGVKLLLIVLVFAVAFAGWRLYRAQVETSHEMAWSDLAGTTEPASFARVAGEYGDPAVKMLAALRGADLYRQQAVQGWGEAGAEPTAGLEQAEALYKQVVEGAQHPVYRINALLGLAAVAETRQNWEAADQYYAQALTAAEGEFPGLGQLAAQRRSLLDDLQKPITLAPAAAAPTPAEGAGEQPAAGEGAASESLLAPTLMAPATGEGEAAPAEQTGTEPAAGADVEGAPAAAETAAE